ncbi:hypothetical protein CWE09_01475 [Aliidiomarina minuta]|uniref:DUF418 domain-containing protein n=1 Tax=Aliidiomarina minuta TaxID=880057 RepID=A0A432W5T6_9GAMM|nr:DUF418 domain-containing protein [Aliidiomarina minuta]RUO25434.1 hypothetical protein CWE09_01475 [Aliidiomarina minuta]
MPNQRLLSLDLLRGVAVLGIFLLNITSMGLPITAYINPTAYGDFSGIHLATWVLTHVLAEQKFIAMFALLFGAGIALFTERAQAKELPVAKLHYRRMGWLLIFGALHAWLLWYGDILFIYAVAGMLVYTMRRLRTYALLIWSAIFFLIPYVMSLLVAASMPMWSEAETQNILAMWQPSPAQLEAEVSAMTGSYSEQFAQRAEFTWMMQTQSLFLDFVWRTGAFMLLGMFLYRWGVLSAKRSQRFYRYLVLLLIPGYLLSVYGVAQYFAHGFSFEQSMFVDSQWNYFASIFVVTGYIGLIILWLRSNYMPAIKRRLQAIGRMAFTCYIMHTLIGVVIFNLFGLFGQLERFHLLLIVFAVWAFQLWFAPWYLSRYAQGPLEALWRRLTYGKRYRAVKSANQ